MKYFTVFQASKYLNLSASAVLHKIKRNKRKCFPGAIKPGHDWLIPYKQVLKEKKFLNLKKMK